MRSQDKRQVNLKLTVIWFLNLIFLIFLVIDPSISSASPNFLNLQSRILKPTGAYLESPAVSFRFTITDSVGTCVIFQEDFSNLDMTNSKGMISVKLGSGVKSYPAGAMTMKDIFNNFNNPVFNCQSGGTYSAAVNDQRKLIMQFNDGSGWQTAPGMEINSTPFSLQALSAQNLGSYPATDYLRTAALPTCAGGQALHFNGAVITCVAASGGGSVTSVTSANADISVATTTTTPVLTLNVGTGANQIVKLDGTAKLPAVDASLVTGITAGQIPNLDTSKITTGTLAAARMPALTGDVTTSVGTVATTIANNAVTSAKISDGEIVNVDINNSAAIARSKLASGTNNHVLINDGSGAFSSEANLAISRGGTGAGSFSANQIVGINGTGTALTSFSCSNGEVIKFNGSGAAVCGTDNDTGVTSFLNGGNSFGANSNLGTNDNFALNLKTNNTARIIIDNSGNVGIGAASAGGKFEVTGATKFNGNVHQNSGQMTAVSYNNVAGTTFDFDNGNIQYTTADCQAMTLTNMKDGGSYTVVIRGTVSGTCVFTSAGDTFLYMPANSATVSGTKSIYNFLKVGTEIYVNWTSGYL